MTLARKRKIFWGWFRWENLSKGLRAESARAVTVQQEWGRLFDGSTKLFTETAVTPERKVEKLFPKWEINRQGEG